MKRVHKLSNPNLYVEMAEIVHIGNSAIKEAKEENRKLGIPGTFWKRGNLYFVLASGEITKERPDILK